MNYTIFSLSYGRFFCIYTPSFYMRMKFSPSLTKIIYWKSKEIDTFKSEVGSLKKLITFIVSFSFFTSKTHIYFIFCFKAAIWQINVSLLLETSLALKISLYRLVLRGYDSLI